MRRVRQECILLLVLATLLLSTSGSSLASEQPLISADGPVSDGTPPATPSQQPGGFTELLANRTSHSKTFVSDDGQTFRLDASISPLHWLNGSTFEDINSTLVASTASVPQLGDADLEMTEDAFEWFALQTFNAIPLLLFRNRSVPDTWVSHLPEELQWRNDLEDVSIVSLPVQGIVGQVSGPTLLWEDAYGAGRNLTIELGPGRMQKALTLDAAPPAPPQFILDGGNPVLELEFIFRVPAGQDKPDLRVDGVIWDESSTRSTGEEVVFELAGAPLFVFRQAFAQDALGNGTALNMTLTSQGPNLRVGIRTPLGFLENATYPVVIDPTVDVQVGAGADDTDTETGSWSNSRTSPDCPGRDNSAGSTPCDASFRWSSVAVPAGATVTAATFEVYTVPSGDDGPNVRSNIYLEDADSPAAPTSLSDFNGRTRTSAFTAWDGQSFSSGFDISPDISAVVQEVIDRGGWASGQAMQVFWDDDGSAAPDNHYEHRTYDNLASRGAKLHITFTPAAPPDEILLTNPTLTPASGTVLTPFNFTIDYNSTLGTPATLVKVNVSDATNGTFLNLTMTLIGAGPNGTYFQNGTLPVGFYIHFFWGNASGLPDNRTGDLSGPVVTGIPPTVATLPATPVLGFSAGLQGNLTDLGSASSVNVSFQWGDTMGLGNATANETLTVIGTFSFGLTGLSTSTQYFFRARAEGLGGHGEAFGAILNFTTDTAFNPPVVVTEVVSTQAQTLAILEGSVSTLGELNITEANVSFLWGLSPTQLIFNTTPELVSIPGTFAATIEDLDPGTTYFYRARLEWNPETLGVVLSFTTESIGLTSGQTLSLIVIGLLLLLFAFLFWWCWREDQPAAGIISGLVLVIAGFRISDFLQDFVVAFLFIGVGLLVGVYCVFGRKKD